MQVAILVLVASKKSRRAQKNSARRVFLSASRKSRRAEKSRRAPKKISTRRDFFDAGLKRGYLGGETNNRASSRKASVLKIHNVDRVGLILAKPALTLSSDVAASSPAHASTTLKKASSFHLHKANLDHPIPLIETSSETVCHDHNPSVFEVVEDSSTSNIFHGVLRDMDFITKLLTQVAPKGISKLRKPKCLLSQGNVISGRYSGFLMFIMMTVFCLAGGEQDFVPNTNYGKVCLTRLINLVLLPG